MSLVAGGITATALFVSGWVGYSLADIAQRDADARIADARKDTAAALERIAELNKETVRLSADAESSRATVAEANARAAEAQQKANEADLARARLEAQLAPRQIPLDKEKDFVDRLSQFSGTAIHFLVFPTGTSDTSPLASTIYQLLKKAGWLPWQSNSLSGQALPGIVVAAKAGSSSNDAQPSSSRC